MFRIPLVAPVLAVTMLAMGLSSAGAPAIADPDFRAFLPKFEEATRRFMSGDATDWKEHVSHRPDGVIMGAWGAYEKGWPEVSARYDWAVARFRNADAKLEVEYLAAGVSGDIAYTVAIERAEVKLAGQDKAAPMALRVNHIFRKEGGHWKLVLRHADPLIGKIAPAAVLQQ